MPEGQEGSKPPAASISPDILSSLGLNQEDVSQFDKAEIAKKERLDKIRIDGSGEYLHLKELRERGKPIEDRYEFGGNKGALPLTASELKWVPDNLMEEFDRFGAGMDLNEVKAFLEGFGTQALESNDWMTALNAFDIATDGNVQSNEKLMAKLREVAAADKTEGVEIAKTMQDRVNRRAPQSPAPSPVEPPPEPPIGQAAKI